MTMRLLRAQHGRCPICRGLLLHADHPPQSPQEWEEWWAVIRKTISKQHIAFRRRAHREIRESVSSTPIVNGGMEPPQ